MRQRKFRSEILLSNNKRLERMEEVLKGKPGQKTLDSAVWFERNIVKAPDLDPIFKVLPTDVGVQDGRPGHRQRMHSVLVFKDMSRIGAVLASTPGQDAVVTTIISTMMV